MAKKNIKKKTIFITLEGIEASGKSSVITYIRKQLKKRGLKVAEFREPGSTKIGEKIRKILLDKKNKNLSRHTELLLYLAARTQLIEEKLNPAFKKFDCVICDRFFDSTLVYQGYALGLGKVVESAVKIFSLGIIPDLTIILDTAVKDSLARLKNKDRIESRKYSFHIKLKKGYRLLAKKYPKRIKLLNTQKALNKVYQDVEKIVDNFLCRQKMKKS